MKTSLILSLVALCLGVVAIYGVAHTDERSGEVSAEDLQLLEQTLRVIDARLAAVEASRPPDLLKPEVHRTPVTVPQSSLGIEARLDSIENALVEMKSSLFTGLLSMAAQRQNETSEETPGTVRLEAEAIQMYQGEFLDTSNTMDRRAKALGLLSRLPQDSRALDAIMADVLALIEGPATSDAKKDIVDALGDYHDDRLVDAYVALLQQPQAEELQLEIVRNLGLYALQRSDVVDVLTRLAMDGQGRVGRLAERLLAGSKE